MKHSCFESLLEKGILVEVSPGQGWSNLQNDCHFTNESDKPVYLLVLDGTEHEEGV